MTREKFDVVVIGGGGAGLTAAKTLKGMGKNVAIVEKGRMGGECTWSGCVPSKALIRISHVAHDLRELERYGLEMKGLIELDTGGVMKAVDRVRRNVYEGEKPEVLESEGISVLPGKAFFINRNTILVNGQEVDAEHFIIATGSRPQVPDLFQSIDYLTNETVFEMEKLPKSLIVIGGGPVGMELSQAMNRLGVKTSLIQRNPKILKNDDQELAEMVRNKLLSEGVDIYSGVTITAVMQDSEKKRVTFASSQGLEKSVYGEKVIVATGRRANLSELKLENAGIEVDKGALIVDDTLRTSAPNIYACGDVVGPYRFSHVAEYHGVTAALNTVLPIKRKVDYENIIWVTYTDPEFAHAGYTEEEAREKWGDDITVYRYNFESLDRAKTDVAEEGLGKFIISKEGKLIGAHILGRVAGELIHESQIIKSLNIDFSKIQSVMHSYPSFSDITRQVGKRAYIDQLNNNVFIKFMKKMFK